MNWFQGKRVLVPFDFSDESAEAVKVAVALADRKDDVHVLHVLVELPATDPVAVWDELSDEKRRDKAHQAMEKQLSDLEIDGVHLDVSIGNPGTVIADLAEEIEAGLVVIPSHGYTGIKRLLLGSVAERVVRLTKCPVLVLKKREG